jgi:hypothetical protein
MANTYIAIATTTVGSGGASDITFSSIPGTYTDLAILISARTNRGDQNDVIRLQFNGSTSSYSYRLLFGTGSSVGSDTGTPTYIDYAGYVSGNVATASVFGNVSIYIPNYTSSNNKSISADGVAEHNATNVSMGMNAGLWSNSSAITSVKIFAIGSFLQYTTATLYGIKNS